MVRAVARRRIVRARRLAQEARAVLKEVADEEFGMYPPKPVEDVALAIVLAYDDLGEALNKIDAVRAELVNYRVNRSSVRPVASPQSSRA